MANLSNQDADSKAPKSAATRVVKNSLIYMVGQLVSWIVAFISISYVPRGLGEVAIGQWTVAWTAVFTVASLLTLSIEQYLTPEIARTPQDARSLLKSTFGLRIALLPLLILASATSLLVMHAGRTVWILGLIFLIYHILYFFYLPCRNTLLAWEDARAVSLCDLGQVSSHLFALPFTRFGVIAYLSVWGCVALVVMSVPIMRVWIRLGGIYPQFSTGMWRNIVLKSVPFLVNEWTQPVLGFTTVFLLKQQGGGEGAVGVYSQAMKLQGTFLFIPTAIASALLPSLTRLVEENHSAFENLKQRMVTLMIAAGLPILVLAFMLADPFCLFLYKDKFQSLPTALRCSGIAIIPLYVTLILYRFLVAEQRNAIWSRFMVSTIVLNAILCYFLIPITYHHPAFHSAAAGATLSFAIAEAVSMVGAFILLKINPLSGIRGMRLVGAIVSSLCMAGTMWLTRDLFFVLRGAIGIASFGLIGWQLHILGKEEQEKLSQMVLSRLRR